MGTRGAYGFRIGDIDKVTYTPGESLPSEVGLSVVDFVCAISKDELHRIAQGIKLVSEGSAPTLDQIAECIGHPGVSLSQIPDWYALLRGPHGDLTAYKKGLRYMVDNSAFLRDSVFCEWAYILDVDADTLEVYRGFQKHLGSGRYNHTHPEHRRHDGTTYTNEFTGVALLQAIPLAVFRALPKQDGRALLLALYTMCMHAEGKLDADDSDDEFDKARSIFRKLMAVDTALVRLHEEIPDHLTVSHSTEPALLNAEDLLRQIHDHPEALRALPADLAHQLDSYFARPRTISTH